MQAKDVLVGLDTTAFVAVNTKQFVLCGPELAWLTLFFEPVANAARTFRLLDQSPFLVDFVSLAMTEAATENGSVSSGPWIEVAADGNERPFEAKLLCQEGQRVLIIQALGDAFCQQVQHLQVGREQALQNEQLGVEVLARTLEIRQREEEVAHRLLVAAGYRDQETGAHVKRIGLYSEAIAKTMGLSPAMAEDIRLAAPMHDIGKIAIPDRVLLKPGRLDDDEFVIMQTHAEVGAKMLEGSAIPMLQMACRVACCHHEKWDGSGYPRGLVGRNIPQDARIVCVADVFDAMINKRVYKPPISEKETCHFIRSKSGLFFDPEVVTAFFDIYHEIQAIRARIPEAVTVDEFECW